MFHTYSDDHELWNNFRYSKHTGRSNWKLFKVNGWRPETVHFRPYVGKATVRLRGAGGIFFENCKQRAENSKQIFENWKNLLPLKHILALLT